MVPQTHVISQPFSNVLACTGVCGACNDEWPKARAARKQRIMRSHRHHGPVEIVSIIFHHPVEVLGVGLLACLLINLDVLSTVLEEAYKGSFAGELSGRGSIVNSVRRDEEVSFGDS